MKIAYHKGFNTLYQSEDGLAWNRIKQLGKVQRRLLEFAAKYPGAHSYAKDCIKQVAALTARGLITHHAASQQFEANGRTM